MSDCETLTEGLALTCAQCVIEQTQAATSTSVSGTEVCDVAVLGKTSNPACQVACGTGNGGAADGG